MACRPRNPLITLCKRVSTVKSSRNRNSPHHFAGRNACSRDPSCITAVHSALHLSLCQESEVYGGRNWERFVFGIYNEAESFISISLLWGLDQPCVVVKMWPCWGIFGQPALSNFKPLLVVILVKPHESCWCASAPAFELAAGGTNRTVGQGLISVLPLLNTGLDFSKRACATM